MTINQHNYEIYFIDFHEGLLSAEQVEELMAFLAVHPELKEEFEEYEEVALKPEEEISYKDKADLMISEETGIPHREEQAIAVYEGDEQSEDEKLVAQSALYQKTRSHPDQNIKYPDPASLKRSPALILAMRTIPYAAAAIIVLFLGLAAWFTFSTGTFAERDTPALATVAPIKASFIPASGPRPLPEIRNTAEIRIPETEIDAWQLQKARSIPPHPVQVHNSLQAFTAYLLPRQVYLRYEHAGQKFASGEEKKEKSLVGKVFSGFFNKLKAPFEPLKNDNPEDDRNFSIWNLAEVGIMSVNAMGDHDYTLLREYDERGRVRGITLLEE